MPSPFRSAGFRWAVVAPLMFVAFVASFLFVTFHLTRAVAAPKRNAVVAELDATDPTWRTTALTDARNASLPPPEQNAAVLATRAHEKAPQAYYEWNNSTVASGWVGELKAPHLPHKADVAELRAHLAPAREAVELARAVRQTAGGGVAYSFREPNVIGTNLEPQQRLRRAMGLLMHDALLQAYDRRADAALDSCLAVLAVARGIGDDPCLISQLIRMAGVAICIGSTERTLAWVGGCDDAKLAELDRAFAAEAEVPRLVYGLRGERAVFCRICENIDSGTFDLNEVGGPFANAAISVLVRARLPEEQAVGLEHFNQMIAAAGQPVGRERAAAVSAVEDDCWRLTRAGMVGPMPRYMLLRLLMPAVSRMNEADNRTVAWLNAARVAIACERHRQKTGTYPTTLDELPKELLATVPTDPFTGNPILYKKLADGAVAYSTGGDGTDDGAAKLNPRNEKGNDLGFRLWTLESRRQTPEPKVVPSIFSPGFGIEPDTKPGAATAPPPLSPWVRPERE